MCLLTKNGMPLTVGRLKQNKSISQPCRKAKPRPAWDDSIKDPTEFKLSKDELKRRHEAHKSKNVEKVKAELNKKGTSNHPLEGDKNSEDYEDLGVSPLSFIYTQPSVTLAPQHRWSLQPEFQGTSSDRERWKSGENAHPPRPPSQPDPEASKQLFLHLPEKEMSGPPCEKPIKLVENSSPSRCEREVTNLYDGRHMLRKMTEAMKVTDTEKEDDCKPPPPNPGHLLPHAMSKPSPSLSPLVSGDASVSSSLTSYPSAGSTDYASDPKNLKSMYDALFAGHLKLREDFNNEVKKREQLEEEMKHMRVLVQELTKDVISLNRRLQHQSTEEKAPISPAVALSSPQFKFRNIRE